MLRPWGINAPLPDPEASLGLCSLGSDCRGGISREKLRQLRLRREEVKDAQRGVRMIGNSSLSSKGLPLQPTGTECAPLAAQHRTTRA